MSKHNLNLLLGSQLFSVLGAGIIQFAIALYVLDLTKSALTFSVIASLAIVGKIICLPICGVLADRLPKKSLLLSMDISYAILTVVLVGVLKLSQPIVPIGIVLVILGLISAFETPVVQSTLPLICEKATIPQASGAVSSIGIIGNIIAPILGAVFYDFSAVSKVFYISLFFYLLGIICEGLLQLRSNNKSVYQGNLLEVLKYDTSEVLRYLKNRSILIKVCLITFILNFMMTSFIQVLVPYLARVQMGISNRQFGVMNTIFAFGGLLGAMSYSVFGKKIVKVSLATLLYGVALLFFCLVIPYYYLKETGLAFGIMLVLVAVILAVVTTVSIQLMVYVQLVTDQKLLGRVMSFLLIIATIGIPAGQLLFGSIGNKLTPVSTAILCVVIAAMTIVIATVGRKTFNEIQETSLRINQ